MKGEVPLSSSEGSRTAKIMKAMFTASKPLIQPVGCGTMRPLGALPAPKSVSQRFGLGTGSGAREKERGMDDEGRANHFIRAFLCQPVFEISRQIFMAFTLGEWTWIFVSAVRSGMT